MTVFAEEVMMRPLSRESLGAEHEDPWSGPKASCIAVWLHLKLAPLGAYPSNQPNARSGRTMITTGLALMKIHGEPFVKPHPLNWPRSAFCG